MFNATVLVTGRIRIAVPPPLARAGARRGQDGKRPSAAMTMGALP